MLFVKTFKLSSLLCAGISLSATLVCAISDELYQYLLPGGRAGQVKDVLFDMLGALIGCVVLFALIQLVRAINKRAERKPLYVTSYSVSCKKLSQPLRIALVADLHDNPHGRVLDALKREKPELILIPGDLTDDERLREDDATVLRFLRACAEIAPTFYSLGNHEIACYHRGNPFRHPIPVPLTPDLRQKIEQTGAVLLDNSGTRLNGMLLFGLTSGINGRKNEPDPVALKLFSEASEKIKILLCHHPEYYMSHLQKTDADLIVCGHAHGGHWRFFGRGIYAPGQGLLPKYTSGVLDGRCVISRGIGNHTSIPRLFNRTELVVITLY